MNPGEKSQYELDQAQRQADRRARSEVRKAKKAFGEAALGGRTLSEALRGATNLKERKEIRRRYEKGELAATDPFATKSSNSFKTIGKGDLMVQSAIIVVDGFIEEIDMIVGQ